MASITVEFYGLGQFYLGIDRISLDADNTDDALAKTENMGFQEQLKMYGIPLQGKMSNYSLVLLNGVNLLKSESTKLRDGDVLKIIPILDGG